MKCLMLMHKTSYLVSPSVWREWIEIFPFPDNETVSESPSVWREWIEIPPKRESSPSQMSPSVWREWIEISSGEELKGSVFCLPPCGGSGLKCLTALSGQFRAVSPSVWREWIEIPCPYRGTLLRFVSLRVEGVD